MKLWPLLGILSSVFARKPQTFEITATKFADGSCELHQWRPTQLHKDVTETSPAYLELQHLPADSEGSRSSLMRVYGHEEGVMLRLLEGECINTRPSEPHIPPGPSPQLILGNRFMQFKPLPSSPPLKLTPLLSSGPSDNRIDLVFFADGYTAEEESKFLADAERLALDISANQTFATVKPVLNIWAAFTPSNETGIGTEEERKDTAFGLYRVGTELRAIYCGKKPVARAACASLGTGCDYPILLANSPYYGGLGGEFSISTASILNGALVLRHELGHSIIKVGEEYDGGYAYFGPNSAHSINQSHIKWESWLSDPLKLSKEGIIPERAVSPLQAYPWTMLNHSSPYTAFFNSSGTYSSYMIRFSLSGLPKNTDLIVLLDGVDLGWAPRPEIGIDRWHYDILRNTPLYAGIHNLTFSLGMNGTEGLAQLCSFEIIEYGNSAEFNTTIGNIGAYPTFSMWNGTTYRPTNEGCLMRQVVLPQFCKPCSEGLWLQLLKRVDLIDHVEVIWDDSRENVTIQLTSVGLGQFRAEPAPHRESLEFSWTLNGSSLSEFTNKTTIMLPYTDAAGSWEVFARFRTEEVQTDPKDYLKTRMGFSI